MRWGETLIDIGSLPTEVVCPSGFKPSVTPITHLIFIGSFFGYSTQLLNLCRYLYQFRLLNLKVGIRTPQPYWRLTQVITLFLSRTTSYLKGWLVPLIGLLKPYLTQLRFPNPAFQPLSVRCLFIIVTKFLKNHQIILSSSHLTLKATNNIWQSQDLFSLFLRKIATPSRQVI